MSSVVDEAESLLVTCRFAEARELARSELTRLAAAQNGVPAAEVAEGSPRLRFGDLRVELVECTEADLLVAVLLQCGYELRRPHEYRFCHEFYSKRAVPFSIAMLWLQLRLAEGEHDFVLHALEGMRAALIASTPLRAEELREVVKVLVKRVLLPAGKFEAAKSVLRGPASALLARDDLMQLLEECARRGQDVRRESEQSGRANAACASPNSDTAGNSAAEASMLQSLHSIREGAGYDKVVATAVGVAGVAVIAVGLYRGRRVWQRWASDAASFIMGRA
jgi:type IV secretory pathway VirB2 component (pilin)